MLRGGRMNQRYATIQVGLLEDNWSFVAVIIFPHIGLVPVLPSFGSSNLQVTSLLTILAAMHLVTVVGLEDWMLSNLGMWMVGIPEKPPASSDTDLPPNSEMYSGLEFI